MKWIRVLMVTALTCGLGSSPAQPADGTCDRPRHRHPERGGRQRHGDAHIIRRTTRGVTDERRRNVSFDSGVPVVRPAAR